METKMPQPDLTARARSAGEKLIHMADKVAPDGRMSAKCFTSPRAISLSRATWTIRPDAVTCPKCRAILEASNHG